MPRVSPYVIELSERERRVLETRSRRYTSPYREVVRAKIVLMAAKGLENKTIASRLDLPFQIVSKWRKRFSADEKTSIQARVRCHPTVAANSRHPMLVEQEYERAGSLAYIVAWDVHRAKLFGRLEPSTGIEPFGRLVGEVMGEEPYRSARRVFWVLDNGSSHRGAASVHRLQKAYPNLIPVHLPIHASWLNQVEIYFSILQRKVLTPPDANSLEDLAARIIGFQTRYEVMARPFEWKFTRADLAKLLARLGFYELASRQQAA